MWLKQKVFTFSIEGAPAIQNDSFDSINVVVNQNKTTIKLSQLFAKLRKFKFDKGENNSLKLIVEGWSILQLLKADHLRVGEKMEPGPDGSEATPQDINVSILFQSEELGFLKLESIENPWFILNDVALSDEELKSINDKLLELSGVNTPVIDEVEEESPHTLPSAIVNKSYEKGRDSFIKRGFEEFKVDNYRFLLSNKDDKFKATFVILHDEKNLSQYNEVEKVTEKFFKVKIDNNETAHIKTLEEGLFVEIVENEEASIEDKNELETDQNN